MTTLLTLPAGPCKACSAPLPARPLRVGAAYCEPCRVAKVQAVVDAGKAIDQEVIDAAKRELAKQTEEYLARSSAHPAKCLRCGAEITGVWGVAYCAECRLTVAAESTSEAVAVREMERRALHMEQKAMTIEQARLAWANLPPDIGRTFDLVGRLDVAGLAKAVAATKLWASGGGPTWLVLNGSEGTGKSHLAEAAARSLALRGQRTRWENVGELLDRLRTMSGRDEENAFAHMAQVTETPYLILDDLGKTKPTPWVLERLYMMVNSRAVLQKRTLITTNESMASLEAKTNDYIAARVFDTGSGLVAVVTVTGASYRTGT